MLLVEERIESLKEQRLNSEEAANEIAACEELKDRAEKLLQQVGYCQHRRPVVERKFRTGRWRWHLPLPSCCPLSLSIYAFLRRGDDQVETVSVTLELPVSAPLSSSVRALEAARDAQTDPRARQVLAAVAALASRGLIETLARSLKRARDKGDPPAA